MLTGRPLMMFVTALSTFFMFNVYGISGRIENHRRDMARRGVFAQGPADLGC
ncbi:MAG: hypothetical protein MZU97_07260 [Bacillus subtilis]|nr:hypothetical protein [Bacillus subtilis]